MWCSLRTASAADRRYGIVPYAAVNFCRNHLKRPDNPRRKKIPGSPPKKREWLLHSVFWGLAAKEYSVPVVCHSVYFWCIVGTYMFYGVGVIIISVRVGEKNSGVFHSYDNSKAGSRVQWLFSVVPCTALLSHSKKYSRTVLYRSGMRIVRRHWLLFCRMGHLPDVRAACTYLWW